MSLNHFFKQVPFCYALTRRRIVHCSPLFPPFLPFSLKIFPTKTSSILPISSSAEPGPWPVPHGYNQPYLSVRLRFPKKQAHPFSDALLSFGASSVSLEAEDPSDGNSEISIVSTFAVSEDVRACISRAADSMGLQTVANYEVERCNQSDWIQKTQESFHPIEVTQDVWIFPEWISPSDIGATNIILNPGLAFGTGDHPTTMLCLLLLRRLIKGNELLLDYGTGSGVLGIAALKFGAEISVGIDIDPQAIMVARRNVVLNNIKPENFQLHLIRKKTSAAQQLYDGAVENDHDGFSGSATLLESDKFDIVVANILLNTLLELADHIVSFAKPGATVVLSGVLTEQIPFIQDRYALLLDDITVSEMENWACLSGVKKSRI